MDYQECCGEDHTHLSYAHRTKRKWQQEPKLHTSDHPKKNQSHKLYIILKITLMCRVQSFYRNSPNRHGVFFHGVFEVCHHILPHKTVERMNDVHNDLYHSKKHKYEPVMLVILCKCSSMRFDGVPAQLVTLPLLQQIKHMITSL